MREGEEEKRKRGTGSGKDTKKANCSKISQSDQSFAFILFYCADIRWRQPSDRFLFIFNNYHLFIENIICYL